MLINIPLLIDVITVVPAYVYAVATAVHTAYHSAFISAINLLIPSDRDSDI